MQKAATNHSFFCEKCQSLQPFEIIETDFLLSLLECGVCKELKVVETERLEVVEKEKNVISLGVRKDTEAKR